MKRQQVISSAIQKAVDGGWKHKSGRLHVDENGSVFVFMDGATDGVRMFGIDTSLKEIIFNHDFAKALWGEEPDLPPAPGEWPAVDAIIEALRFGLPDEAWKRHLQQMVVADDPIKYLGENI